MLRKIYFWLFAILYLTVAIVSFTHAVEFFELANNSYLAYVLAGAFEIGQAAVLFSLLTSPKERGKVMPWTLMGILTLVQIIGNVYASYKYMMLNSLENLQWFKEPIFVWTDLPDNQATVIVTYLVGAILPLVALLLTAMVTNQLSTDKENPVIKDIIDEAEKLEEQPKEETKEEIKEEPKEVEEKIEEKKQENEEDKSEETIDIQNESIGETLDEVEDFELPLEDNKEEFIETIDEPENEDVNTILNGEAIPKSIFDADNKNKQSRFVNI